MGWGTLPSFVEDVVELSSMVQKAASVVSLLSAVLGCNKVVYIAGMHGGLGLEPA